MTSVVLCSCVVEIEEDDDGQSPEQQEQVTAVSVELSDELFQHIDEDSFWQIMEDSKEASNNAEKQSELIHDGLLTTSESEIAAFGRLFNKLHSEAYTSDLWAIGFTLNGGCSDDAFTYFRCWVVMQGKEFYTTMMGNPEDIVDQLDLNDELYNECESMLYVTKDAYEEKSGKDDYYDLINEGGPYGTYDWEFTWTEDNLEEVYPKFYAKFGEYWMQGFE